MKTERQMQKNTLLKDGDYISTKDVLERINKYIPNKNILADLDKDKNIVYHTASDIYHDVENLGEGLIDLGLENKHIAIMAENSYLYVICDMAIAAGVGVVTPIDKDAKEELLATLLNKCEADAIICSNHLIKKIESVQKECKNLKTIITIEEKTGEYPFIKDVMEKGSKLAKKKKFFGKELDLDAPVKILFTSGTTGANKGVVLNQRNLAANIINCLDTMRTNEKSINTSMSVLPMHHATELNTHIFARIACGRLTYINDSMKNMMNNIKIFKPSVITIVPMIANAFYHNIWLNAKKAGMDGKLKKGIKLCNLLSKFNINITHKLFKAVYEPFGGNLEQIVCGGAMLSSEVVKGLKDLGIFIVNGYGITECGPLISMNTDTIHEIYSVGKPCPGLEVKVLKPDEDGIGELCVRGNSVSKGYYKDEEATKQVFFKDGFFNTGDLVKIDKKGRIFMTGRKKNAIVLENGKNISPEEVENEIQNLMPYAKDVVVYLGEYDSGEIKQNVLTAGMFIEDLQIRQNVAKIKKDLEKVNKKLPSYKNIQYVVLVDSEYPKTSTRKIKRTNILDKHDNKNGIKM